MITRAVQAYVCRFDHTTGFGEAISCTEGTFKLIPGTAMDGPPSVGEELILSVAAGGLVLAYERVGKERTEEP